MKQTSSASVQRSFRLIQGIVALLLIFLGVQAWILWQVCSQGKLATQGLQREGLPSLHYLASLQENLAVYRLHSFESMIGQEKDRAGKTAQMDALHKRNLELIAALNQLYPAGEGHSHVEALQTQLGEYVQVMGRIRAEQDKDFAAAMKLLDEEAMPKAKRLADAAEKVKQYCTDVADGRAKLTVTSFDRIRNAVLGLGTANIVFATLALGLIWVSSSRIQGALAGLVERLFQTAEQLNCSSGQVSTASVSLAQGASEQAASLAETSASLEGISRMTQGNAQKAQDATELSNQTRHAAEAGTLDMRGMSQAMDAIKASSDNISKIIKTIDEIAFQTNILALNAAVEAARAGEAGMGFAVVAEEVRSLAQRSAQAAKETAESIEDSINKSVHGVQISAKVAKSLEEIVAKARRVDELVAEIAQASKGQSDGISQVNTAMNQMDQITQSNAASAEESASAATELGEQAAALGTVVSELLLLVGTKRAEGQSLPAVNSQRNAGGKAKPAPRMQGPRTAPPSAPGPLARGEPAAAARKAIPLEGAFRNF